MEEDFFRAAAGGSIFSPPRPFAHAAPLAVPVRATGPRGHSIGDDNMVFAAIFQVFYLRGGSSSAVSASSATFSAASLEKTLHYYYLTPVRRELLVAGKYLAGLTVAAVVFVSSAALSFLFIGRHAGAAYSDYIWHGPGAAQLGWYMLVAALACAGYGAVFLMCGMRYRNPMIPAAVVFVWENINPFLPALLQKVSIIYYLRNLLPVEVPIPPPFSVMAIEANPMPAWITVPGLLAVAALILAYTALSARQTEISYGE